MQVSAALQLYLHATAAIHLDCTLTSTTTHTRCTPQVEPAPGGSRTWLLNTHMSDVFMSLQQQRRQAQLEELARQAPPCNGVSVPVHVCVPVVLAGQAAAAGPGKAGGGAGAGGGHIVWTLGDLSALPLLASDERLSIALSEQVRAGWLDGC